MQEQNKSNWEKTCITCNRLFINRNAFAAHSRSCNRHAAHQESDVDSSRTSTSFGKSLQPVVSLTPLSSPTDKTEKSGDSVPVTASSATQPDSTSKKPPVAAPKKIEAGLPALSSTSSSTCKKIGIQVRMNYGKANANPAATSTCVNGSAPSSTFPSAPMSVATSSSSSSANNSRRSSFARSEDQTISGHQSSITRSSSSGAVLAHILETLLDKKGLVKEQTAALATTPTTTVPATATVAVTSSAAQKSMPSSDTKKMTADKECALQASAARKKLPKNKVTVLCEDCHVSYVLDEFKCGTSGSTGGNTGPTFRCALHNCDFKCNDKRQLLPHLNVKHTVMAESELTQVQSTFVAEHRGTQSECHGAAKKKNVNDKTDASATAPPRKASLPSSNSTVLASQTSASSKSNQQSQPPTKVQPPAKAQQLSKAQPQKPVAQQQRVPSAPTLKRKLAVAMSSPVLTALPAKRKPLNVRQSSISHNEPPAVKTDPENAAQLTSAESTTAVAVKRENSSDDACAPAAQAPVIVKKSKKTPVAAAPATTSTPPKTPTTDSKNRSFPRIKIKQTPDKPLVNGIGPSVTSSSSDEENDLPLLAKVPVQTANSKAKVNLRKQYEAALVATELKPTKTPPSSAKVANCNNEISSSSSTPG